MALERETYADDAARVIAHGRLGREAASADASSTPRMPGAKASVAAGAKREGTAAAAASRPGPPSP